MDSIAELLVKIVADASQFKKEVQDAQKQMQAFNTAMGGMLAGIGGANLFGGIISGIQSLTSALISSSSEFETYTTSMGVMLDSMSAMGDTTSDTLGAAGGKAATAAMEIEDALINHAEKIKKIQDQIADVMAGENIIKAVDEMNQKLKDLDESHLQSVQDIQDQIDNIQQSAADKAAQMAQSAADTLADMQSSHDDQRADKEEKFQDLLAKTRSKTAKKALQKKHDEEMKEFEDAYQRQLATKKAQQARDEAEQKAHDKKMNDEKIASLEDRMAKENKKYDEQKAKIKTTEEEKVADYAKDNAKKLADYKQELEDEERSFKIHMAKLKEAQSGASDTGGPAPLEKGSEFAATNMTMKDMLDTMQKMGETSPFKSTDIVQTSNQMLMMDLNAKKMLPTLGDLAAASHHTLGDTFQAVVMGMNGRLKALQVQFGITKDDLIKVGAVDPLSGKVTSTEKFLSGMTKLVNLKYGGAMAKEAATASGSFTILQNKFGDMLQSFKDTKAFADLKVMLKDISDWVSAHQKEITAFITDFVGGVIQLGKAILPIIKTVVEWILHHQKLVTALLAAVTVFAALLAVIGPLIAIFALVAAVAGGPVTIAIAAVIAIITALTFVITYLALHWGDVTKKITAFANGLKTAVGSAFKWIEDKINSLIKGLQDLAKKAADALSHLNPLAKHSPSLVDQVDTGVRQIERAYHRVGNIKFKVPGPEGHGNVSTINHQQYTHNAPSIQQSNTFNVRGEANASNIAAYLGFQLQHKGVV